MRAWVLHDIGDFRYEEVREPELSEQEVLVEVMAAGICGSDISRVYQTGAHRMPLIPGHEFSGVVVKLGTGVEENWLGKSVGVFPLVPCRRCVPCRMKHYEMCRDYSYLGSRRDGGFAEYVAVPVWNLLELPESVSFEEAAMLEPMAVAVHAMRRVDLHSTDTVVVCGLGTIGLLLAMFLVKSGVDKLLVIGNKATQKQEIAMLGLSEDCYCDSTTQNVESWIMLHTEGRGVNVFFECVGKNTTVSQAVDLTGPAGRICVVGNPYSDMLLTKDIYWKILRHQLTVTGTWNSSYTGEATDDWHYVLKMLEEKKIAPGAFITHRFALGDMEQGFRIMRNKTEDYIKIMITGE